MRRGLYVVLVCLLAFVTGFLVFEAQQRAPLRGPNYAADAEPYRAERVPEDVRAEGERTFRLILVGDAGDPEPGEDPTLSLVRSWSSERPERTAVVFLGDNVYPAGLQPDDRERGEAILERLLDSSPAEKIFLPGNHDWGYRGTQRFAKGVLALQQAYIESQAHRGAHFLPKDGCPGPAVVELLEPGPELSGGLTLVLVDLHWWLLDEEDRPPCHGIEATTDFVAALRAVLEAESGENVVIAAHHPIRSGGPHGGMSRGFWRDLGLALARHFYASQDIIEPSYQEAVTLLSEVLSEHPPLAMVGGHDHSLQILDGGDEAGLVVVSGSATRVSSVTATEETLFAHAKRGFVVFDLFGVEQGPTGETLLAKVVEVGHEDPVATFAVPLNPPPESATAGAL